jgi:hypothetical protein
MILYTLASSPLFCLHERGLKGVTFVPNKQTVSVMADGVSIFINEQDDINRVTVIGRIYVNATSARFIIRNSMALP